MHGEEFSASARRYCALVEGYRSHALDSFLDLTVTALLDLARLADSLPYFEGDDEEDAGDGLDHEEWSRLYRSLVEYLGERNHYWYIHEPTSLTKTDPCARSLADDLGDIYRDLRDGLAPWDVGRRERAVWEWRFGYWSHWGAHVFGALAAIHSLRRASREMPPDSVSQDEGG